MSLCLLNCTFPLGLFYSKVYSEVIILPTDGLLYIVCHYISENVSILKSLFIDGSLAWYKLLDWKLFSFRILRNAITLLFVSLVADDSVVNLITLLLVVDICFFSDSFFLCLLIYTLFLEFCQLYNVFWGGIVRCICDDSMNILTGV